MPRYLCELVDKDGRPGKIVKEAASEAEIAALFSGGDSFLVSIGRRKGAVIKARRFFKPDEVLELTVMLSSLLASGLALKDALTMAAEIAPSGEGGKRLLDGLLESILKGGSLSEALDAYGDSFSDFYRGMVRIGERIGQAEKVFPRLAAYLTDRKALRERTMVALAYPSMVCTLALFGAVGIVAFLVPKLLEIFSGLGGAAALRVQRSAATMTAALCVSALCLAAFLAIALVSSWLRRRYDEWATRIDEAALRIPLLGRFLTAYETLNFAYAMETLAGGGISVERGLEEASKVVGNRAYRKAISRCLGEVLKGGALSLAMGARRELPRHLARWVAIGERSGLAGKSFEQVRRYYQGEVDRITSRFTTLVEPVLILLVGCMLTALVSIFILPLFSMYGAML
jgi:general secretion pathway protein F